MVGLVRSGRSPDRVAREFEASAQSIRNRVAQAERDEGCRSDGSTTAERQELAPPDSPGYVLRERFFQGIAQ